MATFESLLTADGVVAHGPAAPEAVAQVEEFYASGLPDSLVNLWRTANGAELNPVDADLLGCEQVMKFVRDAEFGRAWSALGLLPLIHDRQSNYLAVAMNEPLAHRVLHIPHDDGPRLLFCGLESCLEALQACVESGESLDIFLHETDGDYAPDARRPERDQQAASVLIGAKHENHEWNFATQLLDETNLEEFARLLETEHFVRRDVRKRMEAMQSIDVRKLLGADRKAFDAFRSVVTEAATSAGLKVETANSDSVLRIAGKYIELETFFYRRHEPDAMARLVARVRELAAKR